MSVTSLITNAYYQSQIVARELEQVSGAQLQDGLRLLNVLLNNQNSAASRIPYTSDTTLNTVVGQETYFIPGLISLETASYDLGGVLYRLILETTINYKSRNRVRDLKTILSSLYLDRKLGGSDIQFYPLPDQVYEVILTGTFFLNSVVLATDIESILDLYYINFLEYALAELLCIFNRVPVPVGLVKEVKKHEHNLRELPGADLTPQKIHNFRGGAGGDGLPYLNNPAFSNGYGNMY